MAQAKSSRKIPATTANFSLSALWPRNSGARVLPITRSRPVQKDETGAIVALGAVAQREDRFVIWNGSGYEQLFLDDRRQMEQANIYSRIGPGWEAGFSQGTKHGVELGHWYELVHGKTLDENSMEYIDLNYDPSKYNRLKREALRIEPLPTPTPEPAPKPTPAPPSPLPTPVPPANTELLDSAISAAETVMDALRKLKEMAIILVCLFLLGGCAALRTLLPGGPTMADAEWAGTKGEITSIASMIDPRAGSIAALLQAAGEGDPVGIIMSLHLIGGTGNEVRQVVCVGEWVKKCNAFPPNARVSFIGEPVGSGAFWRPTRMTASDFDD